MSIPFPLSGRDELVPRHSSFRFDAPPLLDAAPLPPRACAGASRLDLIAALALVALLFSITGLAGEGNDAHHMALVENQIRAAAVRAKALARESRQPHGIVFDVASDRLGVVDADGELVRDHVTQEPMMIDARAAGQGAVDLISAKFGAAGDACVWDARGQPLQPGSITLRAGSIEHTLVLDETHGDFRTP